jgi:hypothetical protein
MRLFVEVVADAIFVFEVGQNTADEDLVPEDSVGVEEFQLLVGDFDGFAEVVCGFELIQSMIDKNILTLNEAEIVNNKFGEVIFTKLDLSLRHFEVLTDCPNELRGRLEADDNFAGGVRCAEGFSLDGDVGVIEVEEVSGIGGECLGGLKWELDGVLALHLLGKCICEWDLYVIAHGISQQVYNDEQLHLNSRDWFNYKKL